MKFGYVTEREGRHFPIPKCRQDVLPEIDFVSLNARWSLLRPGVFDKIDFGQLADRRCISSDPPIASGITPAVNFGSPLKCHLTRLFCGDDPDAANDWPSCLPVCVSVLVDEDGSAAGPHSKSESGDIAIPDKEFLLARLGSIHDAFGELASLSWHPATSRTRIHWKHIGSNRKQQATLCIMVIVAVEGR